MAASFERACLALAFALAFAAPASAQIFFNDDLTITGDDASPTTFKGILFKASIEGGIAEFRFVESIAFSETDQVMCPGARPLSIRAPNITVAAGAQFLCSRGRGGGGAGGVAGVGRMTAGAGGPGELGKLGGPGGPGGSGSGIDENGEAGSPGIDAFGGGNGTSGVRGGDGGLGTVGFQNNVLAPAPGGSGGDGGSPGSGVVGARVGGSGGCGGGTGLGGCGVDGGVGGPGNGGIAGEPGGGGSPGGPGSDGTNLRRGLILSAGGGGGGSGGGGSGGGGGGGRAGSSGGGGGGAEGGFFTAGSPGGAGGLSGDGGSGCSGQPSPAGFAGGAGGGGIELFALGRLEAGGLFEVVPASGTAGTPGLPEVLCENTGFFGMAGAPGPTSGSGTGGAGGRGGDGARGGNGGGSGASGMSGAGGGGTVLLQAARLNTDAADVRGGGGGGGRLIVASFDFAPRYSGAASGVAVEEFSGPSGLNRFIEGGFTFSPYFPDLVGGPGRYGQLAIGRDAFPAVLSAAPPGSALAIHRPASLPAPYDADYAGFEPVVAINLCDDLQTFLTVSVLGPATSPSLLVRDLPSENPILAPDFTGFSSLVPDSYQVFATYHPMVSDLRTSVFIRRPDGSDAFVQDQSIAPGDTLYLQNPSAVPCPEPTSPSLAAASLAMLALLRARRRSAQ